MEKERNIMMMAAYYLKVNIYMIKELEEKIFIQAVKSNMKENIYLEKNGMEKDMMKMEI